MLPRTEVDYKPIPPISPEEARAAALSMADAAIRLDAADDMPRVLAALGLLEQAPMPSCGHQRLTAGTCKTCRDIAARAERKRRAA